MNASSLPEAGNILRVREFATRDRPIYGWLPRRLFEKLQLRPRLDIKRLDIRAGRCYAVIGKSGAGKTVFNSFLVGWPAFQCGRGTQADEILWWNGKRSVSLSARQITKPIPRLFAWRHVGRNGALFYLPQILPDGRGYAMPTKTYLQHVMAALRAQARVASPVGEEFEGVPEDIRANLDKSLNALSGGERRRVELWARLRVLRDIPCDRPGLLILDEPTTGLDVVQERLYLEMLRDGLRTSPNVAAIVTTHAMHLLDAGNADGEAFFDGVIVVWKKLFRSSRWRHHRQECDVSPAFHPHILKPKMSWESALDLFRPVGFPDWGGVLRELHPDPVRNNP